MVVEGYPTYVITESLASHVRSIGSGSWTSSGAGGTGNTADWRAATPGSPRTAAPGTCGPDRGGTDGREVHYDLDREYEARAMVDRLRKAVPERWKDITKLKASRPRLAWSPRSSSAKHGSGQPFVTPGMRLPIRSSRASREPGMDHFTDPARRRQRSAGGTFRPRPRRSGRLSVREPGRVQKMWTLSVVAGRAAARASSCRRQSPGACWWWRWKAVARA